MKYKNGDTFFGGLHTWRVIPRAARNTGCLYTIYNKDARVYETYRVIPAEDDFVEMDPDSDLFD